MSGKVRSMEWKSAVSVFSLALLTGCQHNPWAAKFVTAQPAEHDVAGTYVIDADSQKRNIKIKQSGANIPVDHSAQIILTGDHKAQFIHVPEDYQGKTACSVTGRGSWRLGRNEEFSVVRASIVNEEPNSSCKGEFAYELMLYGKSPPYKLHVTIGDPDSGDAVQFEKQN